jgi:hypothetical protein
MPIDATTFPNLYQRKGKVFLAQPCSVAGSMGLIFLANIEMSTGNVNYQKTYVADTTNTLANV